jgi:uncharacterized protein
LKRVLITGITGFVGKELGAFLARSGWEIVALVRDPKKAAASLPFAVELHSWRPESPLKDIDAVVHLAGESIAKPWTKEYKQRILRSRVETTRALIPLLGAVQGRKAQVFVGASAIGIYGDRGEEPLREDSPTGKGFLSEVCQAWEAATQELGAVVPRIVTLRLGLVLGRDGGVLQRILPLFRWNLGGRLGSGQQWMSWIHVEDLIALIQFAMEEKEMRGTYNAVAPNPVRNVEFTRVLAGSLHRLSPFPAPALALRLGLGEMSSLLLDSQRVLPDKLFAQGFRFRHNSLKDAILDCIQSNG